MKALELLGVQNTEAKMNKMEEAVMLKDANNLETLKAAKLENIEIDMSEKIYQTTKHLNMIQVMARLGYSAGSEVGLIIVSLSVGDTLKDMELNKQFLIPGTNKVCMYKMKKVFQRIGNGKKCGYDRVFKEDMFLNITDVYNRKTIMLLALKQHVVEFIDQINNIGELYQEDLVKIGLDLGIIATVVSEIEIDSAKKPELKEGLPEVSSYMSQSMNLRSRDLYVYNNFEKIVEVVKDPSNKKDIKFEMGIEKNGFPLIEFDEKWAKQRESVLKSEEYINADEEEKAKIMKGAKSSLFDFAYIKDPLSEFAEALLNQQADNITTMVGHYKAGTNGLFNQFEKQFSGEEAKNANKLQYFAIKVVNMINYNFAHKNDLGLFKLDEAAPKYRNMLYTYGEMLGFSPTDTFCICANAGWYQIKNRKYVKKNNYSFKAMELLFCNEFKYFFNAEAMMKEVDVELPEELFEVEGAIQDGMTLEFTDGEALICESEEHGELYAFRNDVEDYTGKVVINIDEEGYLVFKEEFQAFNFERVEFIMFDSISDTTKESCAMNTEIIESLKYSSAANDIDAYQYRYNECKFDNGIEDTASHKKAVEDFDYFMTLAAKDPEFAIYTGGNTYAYILKNKVKGYMMGRVLDSRTSTPIAEAKTVKSYTTAVGALVIIEK